MTDAPRLFVSYSHDDEEHKAWVLTLATRLVSNGVDVLLDQWDTRLGSDLPSFMERGLVGADRVLAICTERYVGKANEGQGGVGYEKTILTGQLMRNVNSDRIIPVLRRNSKTDLPTFLLSRLFVDFRDDGAFEARYTELLRDIHGVPIAPRPALGSNPFTAVVPEIEPRISFTPERYVSPALEGTVTFDYSNNDGRYVVGAGDMLFETAWARGGRTSIHARKDARSIRTVALALGVSDIAQIADASIYDTSSQSRSPQTGEIVIWQNTAGYFLATQIVSLKSRGHEDKADEIVFNYRIEQLKTGDFRQTNGS